MTFAAQKCAGHDHCQRCHHSPTAREIQRFYRSHGSCGKRFGPLYRRGGDRKSFMAMVLVVPGACHNLDHDTSRFRDTKVKSPGRFMDEN